MLKKSALQQVCQIARQGADRSMEMYSKIDKAISFYDVDYLSSKKVFANFYNLRNQPY
jgi:hypothetical protein